MSLPGNTTPQGNSRSNSIYILLQWQRCAPLLWLRVWFPISVLAADESNEGCYHDPSILEATRKRRIFGQGGKRLLEKVSQELYRSHLVPGYWKPQSLEQRMDRPCRGV